MASANVLRTIFTYAVTGLGPYTIAFDYLARKFVQVTLIGPDRKLLILNTDYRFTSTKAITLIKSAPAGYTQIEIRRYTDASDRLVDFQDGSILRATDLNVSQVQTMHIAEEGRDVASNTLGVDADGNLDARGRKLVNLVDGVADGDAVTIRQMKSYNDSALNSKNAAAQSAAAALASQNASKSSETNAAASQVNANNWADVSHRWAANPEGVLVDATRYSAYHYSIKSEQSSQASQAAASTATQQAQAASVSASSASGSAGIATQGALTASQQADRAKTEADKLGNFNDFGSALTGNSSTGFKLDSNWKSNSLRAVGGTFGVANAGEAKVYDFSVGSDGVLNLNGGGTPAASLLNFNSIGLRNIGNNNTFVNETAGRNFAGAMGFISQANNRITIPTVNGKITIISVGVAVTTNANGDATIGFPQVFTGLWAITACNGNTAAFSGYLGVNGSALSGFNIRAVFNNAPAGNATMQVNYIAMGVTA